MLPTGRTALALAVACLTIAGCSRPSQQPAPTDTPAPAAVVAVGTPTARPPAPSPTPIPAPNVIGRVTPPASPTLAPGVATRLSVALGGAPSAAQIGLFLARERGYFREAGLEIFFHATPSRAAALSAVGGERDQLGLVGGDDVLRARAQGTPVVSVLALDPRGADGYGLVVATTEGHRAAAAPMLKAFAIAAVRGYADAARDPALAVDTLGRIDSGFDRQAASREVGELVPFWRAAGPLGLQEDQRWRDAHRRLVGLGQAAPELDAGRAFTNELALAAAPTATPTLVPTATQRPTNTPTPRPTVAAQPKPAVPSPTPASFVAPAAAAPSPTPAAPPAAAPAAPAPALVPAPTPRAATP